jgi:hypothetical protein
MLARSVKLLGRVKLHTLSRSFNFNVMSLMAAHRPTQEQANLKTVRLAGDDISMKEKIESLD